MQTSNHPPCRIAPAATVRVALAVLAAFGLLTLACGPEEVKEEDRAGLTASLNGYLPTLAQAYTSGNVEPLRAYAAEKEVARVFTRVSELAEEGKYVDATFHQMTVEDVVVWSHANAFVTTVEVWELKVRAYGSDTLLGEDVRQTSRVKYQLKRRSGDDWQVLHRELVQVLS